MASESERRAFYGLISRIAWLAPTVRSAIADQLGIDVGIHKAGFMQWWADVAPFRIVAHLERMKRNGEKPLLKAAWAEVAKEDGISVYAAEQRLKRYDQNGSRGAAITKWLKDH